MFTFFDDVYLTEVFRLKMTCSLITCSLLIIYEPKKQPFFYVWPPYVKTTLIFDNVSGDEVKRKT